MDTCSKIWCFVATIVVLFLVVGLPLLLAFTRSSPKDPTFSVESSTVKAFNLTSGDNRLFCIINLGVRVRNPNPMKHKLADDALSDFVLVPGGDALVNVDAVGLHVGLKRRVAGEVRADTAAGEGRVNVFMTGYVDSDYLGVMCKGVVVDFYGSTVRVQRVDCGVSVTSSSD